MHRSNLFVTLDCVLVAVIRQLEVDSLRRIDFADICSICICIYLVRLKYFLVLPCGWQNFVGTELMFKFTAALGKNEIFWSYIFCQMEKCCALGWPLWYP